MPRGRPKKLLSNILIKEIYEFKEGWVEKDSMVCMHRASNPHTKTCSTCRLMYGKKRKKSN